MEQNCLNDGESLRDNIPPHHQALFDSADCWSCDLGDRLALTITSILLMDVDRAESDRAATAFLLSGVKHLELSVRQEVASVAA
ncbi:hypothetical protein [Chlorogloeopsis sp. ULAP02]|uniref:hypothetical protein n=1 Tax=Chlorogloeopsis sp. ULAP02 TaxID=3107926 RepID=UPI0031375A25